LISRGEAAGLLVHGFADVVGLFVVGQDDRSEQERRAVASAARSCGSFPCFAFEYHVYGYEVRRPSVIRGGQDADAK
jgi:hypothetical protein